MKFKILECYRDGKPTGVFRIKERYCFFFWEWVRVSNIRTWYCPILEFNSRKEAEEWIGSWLGYQNRKNNSGWREV